MTLRASFPSRPRAARARGERRALLLALLLPASPVDRRGWSAAALAARAARRPRAGDYAAVAARLARVVAAHDAPAAGGVRHRRAGGRCTSPSRSTGRADLALRAATTTPTRACSPTACRCGCRSPAARASTPTYTVHADAARRGDVRARGRARPLALGTVRAARAARRRPRRAASIPTSRRWRATPGWPAIAACRRSASRPTSSAARAPTSSSWPSTASAIRCATSTGGRRCGWTSRSCASSRTSAISACMLLVDCGRRMRADDRRRRDRHHALRPGAERRDAAVLRGAEAGRRRRRDDLRHAGRRGALVRAAQGRARAERADGRSCTPCSRRRRIPTTSPRRRTCCAGSASARWSSSSRISATRTARELRAGAAAAALAPPGAARQPARAHRRRADGAAARRAATRRSTSPAPTSTSSRAATPSTGSPPAMR